MAAPVLPSWAVLGVIFMRDFLQSLSVYLRAVLRPLLLSHPYRGECVVGGGTVLFIHISFSAAAETCGGEGSICLIFFFPAAAS